MYLYISIYREREREREIGPVGLHASFGSSWRPLDAFWSHFAGWAPKCFKTAFWRPPGATWRAGARNASKWLSGGLLGLLCGLGPQMLQNGLLEASWGYLAGWGLKCFKIALWRHPGATLRGWGPKCCKTVFWRPPGGLQYKACSTKSELAVQS